MRSRACTDLHGPPDASVAPADRWAPVLALDIAVVVGFALLGRLAHDEGSLFTGTLATAAPFVLGLLAGWLRASCAGLGAAGRARTVRFGWWLLAWTLGGGMLVRWASGDGTDPAFVVVAAVVLAVGLVGRRWWARRVLRR